ARKPENVPVPDNFILATVHRAENTDDPERLKNIVEAINHIASNGEKIILPLHPRTKKMLKSIQPGFNSDVVIIDPVGYLEMVYLLRNCSMVMTDSGGLQKEAFFFKKPCITLRDETEWVELVENRFNVLGGADSEVIIEKYNMAGSLFSDNYDIDLYGNGMASERIVSQLLKG
ncbi:MAG: UDP-N-acetylglucosamine 2-epimerase, partial [bacterium]